MVRGHFFFLGGGGHRGSRVRDFNFFVWLTAMQMRSSDKVRSARVAFVVESGSNGWGTDILTSPLIANLFSCFRISWARARCQSEVRRHAQLLGLGVGACKGAGKGWLASCLRLLPLPNVLQPEVTTDNRRGRSG